MLVVGYCGWVFWFCVVYVVVGWVVYEGFVVFFGVCVMGYCVVEGVW